VTPLGATLYLDLRRYLCGGTGPLYHDTDIWCMLRYTVAPKVGARSAGDMLSCNPIQYKLIMISNIINYLQVILFTYNIAYK
jgi:hypothetical protein